MRSRVTHFLFFLFLFFCIYHTYGGTLRDSLTFYLSFEKGFVADYSRGDSSPQLSFSTEDLALVPGYSGNGFGTGRVKHHLRYAARGNFNGERGTLTFWQLQHANTVFDQRDLEHKVVYTFFRLIDDDRKVYIQKWPYDHSPRVVDRYLANDQDLPAIIKMPADFTYTQQEWHQYAYTWDGKEIHFYFDGLLVGSSARGSVCPIVSSKGFFMIGGGDSANTDVTNRVMDEFYLYDRSLSSLEIYQQYQQQLRQQPRPEVSLSSSMSPIAVDGRMSADEYSSAVAIPLMNCDQTRSQGSTPSILYLTYDDKNLYLFLKSAIDQQFLDDPHTKLLHGFFKKEKVIYDHDVDNDDSLTMDFRKGAADYFMAVNTIDTHYDYSITNQGETITLAWNPVWKSASEVSMEGWFMEAAIPLQELGVKVEDGEILEANFTRVWRLLKEEDHSWAMNPDALVDTWRRTRSRGRLRFAGLDNIAVRFEKVEQLNNKSIDFSVVFKNTSMLEQSAKALLYTGFTQIINEELALQPGEEKTLRFQRRFERPVLDLTFQVVSLDKTRQYFSIHVPVYQSEDMKLTVAPYPDKGILRVSGSFPQLPIRPENSKVQIRLLRGQELVRSVDLPLQTLSFSHDLSLQDLPHAEYHLQLQILEDGKVVLEHTESYTKEEMPDWYGNTIGISEKVPEPWLPMKVEGETIHFLERSYRFAGSLLPDEITVKGENILNAPIRVEMEDSSGAIQVLHAVSQVSSHSDNEVNVEGKAESPDFVFLMESSIEYDGFMWNKLLVTPKKPGASLNALRIVVPLKREYSELICPYDYSLKTTGYLTRFQGMATQPFWIGNADRGLSFLTEHQHNWRLTNSQTALTAERGESGGFLQINLADQPFSLEQPELFEFAFQSTPTKTMPADYRRWRFCKERDLPLFEGERNTQLIYWWDVFWCNTKWAAGETCYPVARPGRTPQDTNIALENGNSISVISYFQLNNMWAASSEFKRFGYEWIRSSVMPFFDAQNAEFANAGICTASRSANDFVMWNLQKYVKQVNLRGLYFDVSRPATCTNANHGCGYLHEGQLKATTNFRATRNLVKRIYTMLHEQRRDAMIMYHSSGQICTPIHGFADAFVDGENFNSILNRNRGYQERLRPDVFRAEYMCRNFGAIGVFLAEFRESTAIKQARKSKQWDATALADYEELGRHTNYVMGLCLLHDSHIATAWMWHLENKKRGYQILQQMDYSNAGLIFTPYWENPLSGLTEKEAIVSVYSDTNQQRAFVVVMNTGEKSRTFTLKLDWQKLGLDFVPGSVISLQYPATPEMHGLAIETGVLPAKEYRVFMVGK